MVSGSLALFGRLVLLLCLTVALTDAFRNGDGKDAEAADIQVSMEQQQQQEG